MSRRSGRWLGSCVAVVGAAAALVGCGTGTSDSGEQADGGVTLQMTHLTDNKPGWEAILAAYKRVEPDVTVRTNYVPVDDAQTSLRAQLGGGNAPDLFVVWPGNGSSMAVKQLAPTGLLEDISSQGWIGQVPEGLRGLLGEGGKTFMWAGGVTPIGAIYNKSVFAEAGVDAVPETWPELLTALEKIKDDGKVPIALGNQTPWVTQLISYAIAPSTAFAQDPNLAQDMLDGRKTFANSGWREVFQRYMELDEKGFFNESPNGTTFEQQQELVGSGKAGMAIQVTAIANGILAAAQDKEDIATFPFPANDEAGQLKIPAGVSAGVGISAKSANKEAAAKFVQWLGEPAQMATFSKANNAVPLVGAQDAQLDAIVAPFAPYIAEDKSVPFMDQQWPNAQVQPAHFAGIQELFAGKTTVDGLLKKLDEAYQEG